MAVNYNKLFTMTRAIAREGSVSEVNEFLERLCGYSWTTEIWFVLWQGGGAYRFTEILRFTGISRSWLPEVLSRLRADALVRMVNGKYQAIVPQRGSSEVVNSPNP